MSTENKTENSAAGGTDETIPEGDYIVRIRGLPWSSSKDDIMKFFSESKIKDGLQGIHMTMSREGRPNGSAYVEFESEEDVEKALTKDSQHIGKRYIEVFRSTKEELETGLKLWASDGEEHLNDACVRLRGVPFECSKEEIAHFFAGFQIVRNGITIPTDFRGRSTGEAYVQFASQDIAEKAMGRNMEKIGHRYIEIFKSSVREIDNAAGPMRVKNAGGSNRFNPYGQMDKLVQGHQSGMARGYSGGVKREDGNYGRGPMFDAVSYPVGPKGYNKQLRGFVSGESLSPFGRSPEPSSTQHRVHLRGIPYDSVEQDIFNFFRPLKPTSVRILHERSGRPSGEADAEFFSHEEAVVAMRKDKEKIRNRYIELFLHSEPIPSRHEMHPYGLEGRHPFGPHPGGEQRYEPNANRLNGVSRESGPNPNRFNDVCGTFPSGNRLFTAPTPNQGFDSHHSW